MAQAFLIIISALGAIYALFTGQGKIALGLLVVAIAFVFAIPNLVTGIWTDVFGALTMILFALGVFVIVFKKKEKETASPQEPNKEEKEN